MPFFFGLALIGASLAGCADAAQAATPLAIEGGAADVGVDVLQPRLSEDAPDSDGSADSARTEDAGSLDTGGGAPDTGAPIDARSEAASEASTIQRCNGFEGLCDRRFDQVVFATTHNSMSNADDGWLVPNQTHPIARQLEDGIRALLVDTYSYLGSSYLCHASCLLGSKPLVDALTEITRFLQDHPNEVLALVIEDHLGAAETDAVFRASGLGAFTYTHAAGAEWPTLRSMIASGRRVFVGAEMGTPPPAWYHHFYDLAWDTPYTFRSADEFSCEQNRGSRESSLFLLNHWIENPVASEDLSRMANARDVLLGRAQKCQMESGKLPNFVAVNHYSVGDLFAVVRELNGL